VRARDGFPTCDPSYSSLTCNDNVATADTVLKFRNDNVAFIKEFSAVYTKMIETGYTNLQALTP